MTHSSRISPILNYRMRSYLTLLSLLLFIAPGAAESVHANTDASTSLTAIEVRQWGEETLSAIDSDFWSDEKGLYVEKINLHRHQRPSHPAFMWSAGVQLSALAAAARLDPTNHADSLSAYVDVLETYWHEHNGIGGYDVQPASKKPDRYYDDNVWIALTLIEAYEISDDARYLEGAIKTFEFVMSGEDDALGGGIYWRENRRESKNTCSNAPAIVAALRLYQISKEPSYLEIAQRLYQWTCSHLQDPQSGLFWDNLNMKLHVDRRKFSYNSALMIRANSLFYEVTQDEKYLHESQRIALAAEQQWILNDAGAVKDAGKFAHMLIESFLTLPPHDEDPRWLQIATNCAQHLHNELRDPNGRYPGHWGHLPKGPSRQIQLIDQASAARVFFVVAKELTRGELIRGEPTADE